MDRISRFALAKLAIKSAVELERYRAGNPLHGDILAELASALAQTSDPHPGAGPSRFFAVGYHRPYMRLVEDQAMDAKSLGAVREYLTSKASVIRAFLKRPDPDGIDDLASFCADLHHELASEHMMENRIARRRRTRPTSSEVAAGFC